MANLSLARIMYGTSEDARRPMTGTSILPALSSHSTADVAIKNVAEGETLGELLHRAWTNLSGKR